MNNKKIGIFLVLLISFSFLTFYTPTASATIIGYDTYGSSVDQLAPNAIHVCKFIAPENGLIGSIQAPLYGYEEDTTAMAAIYNNDESNTRPLSLLASSTEQTIVYHSYETITFPLSETLSLAAGETYWLALSASKQIAYRYDSGTTSQSQRELYDYGTFPDLWNVSYWNRDYQTTIYATYIEPNPVVLLTTTPHNYAGLQYNLTATITDAVDLSHYIWSINNGSGYVNQTALPFISNPVSYNGVWNTSIGTEVSAILYANDTAGVWGLSSVWSAITTAADIDYGTNEENGWYMSNAYYQFDIIKKSSMYFFSVTDKLKSEVIIKNAFISVWGNSSGTMAWITPSTLSLSSSTISDDLGTGNLFNFTSTDGTMMSYIVKIYSQQPYFTIQMALYSDSDVTVVNNWRYLYSGYWYNNGGMLLGDSVDNMYTFPYSTDALYKNLYNATVGTGPIFGSNPTYFSMSSTSSDMGISFGLIQNNYSRLDYRFVHSTVYESAYGLREFTVNGKVCYSNSITTGSQIGSPNDWMYSDPLFVTIGGNTTQDLFSHYKTAISTINNFDVQNKVFNQTAAGYSTWYAYYKNVDETDFIADVDYVYENIPYIKTVEIDDGWQMARGNWVPNEKFSYDLEHIGEYVHNKNLQFGLWYTPFMIDNETYIATERPDILLHKSDGSIFYQSGSAVLDITNPDAITFIKDTCANFSSWGVDVLKIDTSFNNPYSILFNNAGAFVTNSTMPTAQAMNNVFNAVHEGLPNAFVWITIYNQFPSTPQIWGMTRWVFDVNNGDFYQLVAGAKSVAALANVCDNSTILQLTDYMRYNGLNDDQFKMWLTFNYVSGSAVMFSQDCSTLNSTHLEWMNAMSSPFATGNSPLMLDLNPSIGNFAPSVWVQSVTPQESNYPTAIKLLAVFNWDSENNQTTTVSFGDIGLDSGQRYLLIDPFTQDIVVAQNEISISLSSYSSKSYIIVPMKNVNNISLSLISAVNGVPIELISKINGISVMD